MRASNTENIQFPPYGINGITQNEMYFIDIPGQIPEPEIPTKEEDKKRHINIFKQFLIPRVYKTAIIAFMIFFVINYVYDVTVVMVFGNTLQSSSNQQAVDTFLKSPSIKKMIYFCVIGPVIEEFIFRSIIFKVLHWIGKKVQEKNKFFGITIRILAFFISSFIFAFAHFNFNFKILRKERFNFPPYFMMGIIFAITYDLDGYLLASILTHVINNTVSTIYTLTSVTNEGMMVFYLIKLIVKVI
ncbi:hypothetical protein PIROE2DRAFT_17731 [Piromyces sp. E2]|nr:hypothetical protein PIROE2DRAFT_17731 [Piromyces sp. E2]|eukprot:OUM57325.1 hypothetical protein PIROE2DRAFT_17731 [Piromyces sp. E2]